MTTPIIPPNLMKQAIGNSKNPIGTMIAEIRQPAVVQLLANAGFDFVIIDNEHGGFTIETIADLSRTAKYVGVTPLVRIPDVAYPYIAQVLDAGAQGVMLPRVTEAAQVAEAVQCMKYPPVGRRGLALSRGHTNFRSGSIPEAIERTNEETLLIVQIETKQAIEALDEILALSGIDVALVGPADLSIALGVPGQMESPVLKEAIETVIAACQRHNVAPAIHMNDLALATYWAKNGMQVLSSNAETGLMMQAGRAVTGTLREAFGSSE